MKGTEAPKRRSRIWRLTPWLALSIGVYALLPPSGVAIARNLVLPGVETSTIAHLDSDFRQQVERVLTRLENEGFEPRIAASYRSPRRQELIWHVGKLAERVGGPPSTMVRGGGSCHNHRSDERPASLAVDLRGASSRAPISEHVTFFEALGQAAHDENLIWGGDWKRRNRTWARHGLGWDPAHVQSRRCWGALRS